MSDNKVIFWDIDGTLLKSSLENHLLLYLLRNKHITYTRIFLNLLHLSLRWPFPAWHQVKAAYLRGLTQENVRSWVKDCWDTEIQPSLYLGSIQIIQNYHKDGFRQILLSGTLQILAAPLAQHLGFKHLITGEAETNNGEYSGRLINPHPKGLHKVALAEKWLKDNQLTWEQTAAVGDHWADRFLLERVSKAVVIRPGWRLKNLSRKKGWTIISDPESTQEFVNAFKKI